MKPFKIRMSRTYYKGIKGYFNYPKGIFLGLSYQGSNIIYVRRRQLDAM
jgi:hypothetical protein